MKVLNITLINFQRHSNLTLNFNHDINVITGLSDCGKSAIFRALEWVFNFSSISENDYRKEGTKQTSVKILLDNGFHVERIRGNTINRYILSKDDMEDQIFDNFGRETPEEIAKVFGITTIDIENEHVNLNFANQDQLNFLLDSTYSDTFKAKLFNKLTGNEVLDKLFKELNKESLRLKRDIKETEEDIVKHEEQLTECSIKYEELKKKLVTINNQYKDIKENVEIYTELKTISDNYCLNKKNQKSIQDKVKSISIISSKKITELKNKAEQLKDLQHLFYDLESTKDAIIKIEQQKKTLCVPKINVKELKNTEKCISEYTDMYNNLMEVKKKQTDVSHKIGQLNHIIEHNKKELEQTWKECPICPLCKQEKHL